MLYTELQKLKSLYIDFPVNHILFNEKDHCDTFYILVSGIIELIKDKKTILFIENPGEYIEVMPYLLNIPHYYSAKVSSDCTLIKIPNEMAEKIFNQTPEISLFIAKSLAKKFKEVIDLVIKLKNKKDFKAVQDVLNKHSLI